MSSAQVHALPRDDNHRRVFDERRMAFLGHLGELRKRLLWALGALTLTTLISFYFAEQLFELSRYPMAHLTAHKLIVLSPLEMMLCYIKIALLSGLIFASPFLLLQLWLFVAPGLYAHERRYLWAFVALGSTFFIGGAAFCFFVVLPSSMSYLLGMVPDTVEAHYTVQSFFSLTTQLMLAFGAIFELPLVMILLAAAGILPSAQAARARRYWIVIAFVIGGVLTPTPDPLTQSLMAGPLIIFFEFGLIGGRIVERRRRAAL